MPVAKKIEVVGAVIVRGGEVLCARRAGTGHLAGLWEFPGGKIEPGESPQAALVREVDEELQCQVVVGDMLTSTTHQYAVGAVTLTTYYCRLVAGTPEPTEHAEVRWVAPADLGTLEWAPADLPAVALITAG